MIKFIYTLLGGGRWIFQNDSPYDDLVVMWYNWNEIHETKLYDIIEKRLSINITLVILIHTSIVYYCNREYVRI